MKFNISEFRSLRKSFLFAIRGLVYCVKNERNMRIHFVVALLVLIFSLVFELSLVEYAVLFLVISLVFLCEIFNTAIEALVNLSSPFYDSLARIAKDVAAGAVFFSSIVSVVIGIILFGRPKKFVVAVLKILDSPLLLLLFLFIVLFGFMFIFRSFKIKVPIVGKKVDDVKIYKPKKRGRFKL